MNLFTIISIFWLASEIFLARFKKASEPQNNLDGSSLSILWVTVVVSVSFAVFISFSNFGYIKNNSHLIKNAGVLLILIGLTVRWVSILTLKKYFTVNVAIAEDHKLIRVGIYKRLRHPSYTGSLLSFLGLGFALVNWVSLLIILLPVWAAFIYRISIEEKALFTVFGEEYSSYRKTTKMIIPYIY